jgi:hypothetical protein
MEPDEDNSDITDQAIKDMADWLGFQKAVGYPSTEAYLSTMEKERKRFLNRIENKIRESFTEE